ncbi:MAG TPA: DUF4129 domain-containing protein [Terriglobales bacterium]|nr:DUF4129 domain-containing protein [Terriglobales bacterium]
MGARALPLLDQGVELWRHSFREELWRYYVASAPFAAALLWSWQRATSTRLAENWGPALVLTLTYAWRSWGTGEYSRRLLAVCGGGRLGSTAAERLKEMWSAVTLMLLWWMGLPLLLGVGVLYVAAQYVPLVEGRSLVRALRLAGRWWGQQWLLLGLALLVGGIVFINLGIAAIIVPYMLHSLFGLQSAMSFSQTPLFLMQSSLFWMCLLLAVYLALDPVFKCAITVSYQQMQAARNGADLAEAIAQLGREARGKQNWAGVAMVALVALGLAGLAAPRRARAQAVVAAPALARAIRQELRQPPYAWHQAQASPFWQGLGQAMGWVFKPLAAVGREIGKLFGEFGRWLRKLFQGGPQPGEKSTAGESAWQRGEWTLAGLCLLLLVGLIVARLRRGRHSHGAVMAGAKLAPVDVATATAAEQGEREWLAMAQRLQEAGELRLAFRAAFLAGLAGLAERRLVTIRRDRTNREYLEEFRRRARQGRAGEESNLQRFGSGIGAFDEVWYGGREVDAERLDRFVAAQRELLSHV